MNDISNGAFINASVCHTDGYRTEW